MIVIDQLRSERMAIGVICFRLFNALPDGEQHQMGSAFHAHAAAAAVAAAAVVAATAAAVVAAVAAAARDGFSGSGTGVTPSSARRAVAIAAVQFCLLGDRRPFTGSSPACSAALSPGPGMVGCSWVTQFDRARAATTTGRVLATFGFVSFLPLPSGGGGGVRGSLCWASTVACERFQSGFHSQHSKWLTHQHYSAAVAAATATAAAVVAAAAATAARDIYSWLLVLYIFWLFPLLFDFLHCFSDFS
ncbi:unnamed protein product [Gongylonema pulchrum]|uniref:Uncharacterized protein n=1 Tax=Gongylonema pulchrum TaxID=637853 RepID=A0A183E5I3_9BILA|nr:unnamed protein product [Gongylonema pulchrum]